MGNPILAGLGFSLPKRQVSNHDLVGRINTSDEFIVERTGVRTRYHVEPEQAVSALMVPAARQAIEAAGLLPEDIDLLLVNTLSPDHHDPSQACLIQPLLGLRHIPVLDIRAQCSGLLYGLQMARGQILAGLARHVLVVCGEVLSKRMDCSDRGRNLSILLGDGAGAVVVSAGESLDDGLLDLRLGADGSSLRPADDCGAGRCLADLPRRECPARGRGRVPHARPADVRACQPDPGTDRRRNARGP